MAKEIKDGHGNWAQIKDVRELTSGDADTVIEAAGLEYTLPEGADFDQEEVAAAVRGQVKLTPASMNHQRDVLFSVLIIAWSLGVPLPSEDLTSCKKIPLTLRYELEAATRDHQAAMQRRPKAGGSSASNGSSRAGAGRAPSRRA